MLGVSRRLQLLLHGHHVVLASIMLLMTLLIAILDYARIAYDCDLLCWCHYLEAVKEYKPMLVMIVMASVKLLLILILTVVSYTQMRPYTDPPIAHVKQRYCRYLLMRLLAAHEDFLQDNQTLPERHAALLEAIQQFRSDGRRLYERSVTQLSLPMQQFLPVEEEEEKALLKRGYEDFKCIKQLKEMDIYRMILAVPQASE